MLSREHVERSKPEWLNLGASDFSVHPSTDSASSRQANSTTRGGYGQANGEILNLTALGWLARVSNEELGDDDVEPPLPAGLQTLTPAQIALTEFLQIDSDWLAAAAHASPPLPDSDTVDPEIDRWIALQSQESMRATTRLLLEGRGQEAERTLRQEYLLWQREQAADIPLPPRRTVQQIDAGREAAKIKHLETERQFRAAQEAKRQAERKQQLEKLAAMSDQAWAAIDKTLQRGSGHAYDQALQALKDFAEAMNLAGREFEFKHGLVKLLCVHGQPRRLDKTFN